MILMALVCTALTKPLVILIDKISSNNGDAYSFTDLHLNTSGITETLRRASRMVYGKDLPAEWTLPALDEPAIPEESKEGDKRAHLHDAAAETREQATSKPPADPAAAFRVAYFWRSLTSSASAYSDNGESHAGREATSSNQNSSTPPVSSAHAQGHRSSNFRQISKVKVVE
jgi:hypothetical protein